MIAVVGAMPGGSRITMNPDRVKWRIRYSAVIRAMISSA
jgi:hypothetical protein